ncbi:hypothetical protein PVL29_009918 [Vitis rotundifolia]|uniref:Uncharacterized protein n=1 Tax=Vitis rotundifolia TaxID=103349 RepID=A0AA39DSM8_VITRO|nr:hypothetical protein PVL29_009918 [Vitis rotundifolia]
MASSISVKVTCLVVMSMLVASPMAIEGLSGDQVATDLVPCIPYLIWGWASLGGSGRVTQKTHKIAIPTLDNHRIACRCLINDVAFIPGVDINVADDLPCKCGVTIPYTISPPGA